MITVEQWGFGSSVQDAGRIGWAHLGRGRGGAVDLGALELANRLLGNPIGAAAFETMGGLRLAFERPTMVVVTGAPVDLGVEGGSPVGWGMPVVLGAGARLHIHGLHDGARCYVGVRGGLVARPHGFDTGPEPDAAPSGHPAVPRPRREEVPIWPGPRLDWFDDAAWRTLTSATYTVSADSNRVGVRLIGPPLGRIRHDELPSEGMVEGAVQVPAAGLPIVMLADHPVTGGYPVIAVVDPADLVDVAQSAPGAVIRFRAQRRR